MKMFLRSKSAIARLQIGLMIIVIVLAAVAGYFGYLALTPGPAPLPGEFELSDLVISPTSAMEGEDVTISVNVTNVGEAAVTGDITLRLDGAVETSKTVTVEAEETETVTFTVTKGPGEYEVDVHGLTDTFTVTMAIKNADTFIYASIGEPETVDPAWVYDSASIGIIYNVYEPLIRFDGEHTDKFVPLLATEVPSVENGLVSPDGLTYTFPIRTGVKFHNGETLTPADVEYTFERALVFDRSGGPCWMLYEPLLDRHGSRHGDPSVIWDDLVNGTLIDNAIESNATHVWFNLARKYPPFVSILAQGCGPYIVNKKFVAEHGGWPGTWNNWTLYNNPTLSPLDDPDNVMSGTGPYKFKRWEHGVEYELERFDDYWQGPATLKRFIYKKIDEWSTRKLLFTKGDVDYIYVPRAHMMELEGETGLLVLKDLADLACTGAFYNQKIDPTSPYIGSGEFDADDNGIPDGVPPDFFSDINVRKAFSHCFNWTEYIEDVWFGEATQIPSPIVEGLPYRNPEQEMYHFNLTKAEEYFKLAWGGELWTTGFELTILFNIGNVQRETAAKMFKANVESINDKFSVRIMGVEWPVYLKELVAMKLSLYVIGWGADYPDPHNFAHPFMHSAGDFAGFSGYNNTLVDELLYDGMNTTDPTERQAIYYQLESIYYEDNPNLVLYQPVARRYFRSWVKGYVYNPIWPDEAYVYELSKAY